MPSIGACRITTRPTNIDGKTSPMPTNPGCTMGWLFWCCTIVLCEPPCDSVSGSRPAERSDHPKEPDMSEAHEKPLWAQSKREKANAERVAEGLKPKRRILPWIILAIVVLGIAGFILLRPPAPSAPETGDTAPVAKQIRQSETATIRSEERRVG